MDAPARKSKLIKGATGDWEVVIGMEVHAQVTSQAKLFSGASTAFGGEANAHVSLVDAAMPGMLPVINAECVRQAVRTGLGLKAKINLKSVFDRKNYFYPDLPQGYQISQYKQPIVGEGEVTVDMPDGETVRVGIERLHLEQDAGKLLHEQHPTMSLVDLNRSGVALMEIVTKPDLRSADEAKAFHRQAAQRAALPRHLRRRHGKGQSARRRQCLGAQARRAARHALRDQERQFDPLHRPGDRARGAPPDRPHRGRRQDRAGDAAVRSRQGRDALDALQGGGARLPLFPRSGSVAAGAFAVARCRSAERSAGTAGREEVAFHARLRAVAPTTPTCSSPSAKWRNISRPSCRRRRAVAPRSKACRQLGDQRAARPAQQGGRRRRRVAGLGRAARRHSRPDRRRHDLRQNRQGRVRNRLGRGRRSARDRRSSAA